MSVQATKRLRARSQEDIEQAAALLRAGELVAFPTETVYGLGANALDPQAVAKIFAAKRRPAWDPLIVHVHSLEAAMHLVLLDDALSAKVEALAAAFWPGPLTLLLPRSAAIGDAVTAGRPLVGIRIPRHPVALSVLRAAGIPLAAPSANRFGHTSPTTAAHVLDDLDGRISAVLDGGPTEVGVESTVLDPESMTMYRPGAVSASLIAAVTGYAPSIYIPPAGVRVEALPSPGVGIRHYAPRATVVLVASETEFADALLQNRGQKLGVMLPDGWGGADEGVTAFAWGPWTDHAALAARLFAGLRALDDAGADVIVCPLPQGEGIAAAIRDRLHKAAKA